MKKFLVLFAALAALWTAPAYAALQVDKIFSKLISCRVLINSLNNLDERTKETLANQIRTRTPEGQPDRVHRLRLPLARQVQTREPGRPPGAVWSGSD